MGSNYLFIASLLIMVVIIGVVGMFFYQEYLKKICCLSISYSSFLLLMIILSFKNSDKFSVILTIMVSILIVFASSLFIGINIAKNIEDNKKDSVL